MPTPEQRLTEQVIRHLKKLRQAGYPIWWVKLHGGPQQRRGLPDLLVIANGRHIFIELKAPGGKLSKLQQHTIAQINAAGGRAVVCRTIEAVERTI
jgi:hypothetical protein